MYNKKLLGRIFNSEQLSYDIYSKLYEIEGDKKLRKKLKELKDLDTKHIAVWNKIYAELGLSVRVRKYYLEVGILMFVRKLFGKGLTLSIINSLENRKVSDLSKFFIYIPTKQRVKIVNYLVEELYQENLLKRDVWESGIISHIRDIVFGMNDGLVEVLAAVAGFTGVLQNNLLIAVAGAIVGVSGTISMAVGAYLSSKSELDVDADSLNRLELELQVARERLIEDLKARSESYKRFNQSVDELIAKLKQHKDPIYKVLQKERENPLLKFLKNSGTIYDKSPKLEVNPFKDALYVGAFYLVGAIIPLISFFTGIMVNSNPYLNIVVSVLLTSVAISVVSFVIALNSNESIGKYVGRSVALSLVAAAVTFFAGHLASVYLHIAI